MFGGNEAAYRRMVLEYFKPMYEQIKKDCKNKILLSGKRHMVMVDFGTPSIGTPGADMNCKMRANLSMDILLICETEYANYPSALAIYEPSHKQVMLWLDSPAARKAKIKFALTD